MAKKEASAAPAAAATEGGDKPRVVGVRGPKNVALDATIHFLKDKSGKSYGPDNNPKRAGTAGHQRFALYTDGMTVQQFLDAGGWSADVTWDLDKHFIEVRGGTPAGAAKPAADAAAKPPAANKPAAKAA